MADGQWKKIGVISGIVSLIIIIVGIAWAGGGRVTGVEKDIGNVKENAMEDRKSIEAVAVRTTALEEEAAEAKLRDERIAGQFTKISAYMSTEAKKSDEIYDTMRDVQKVQGEQTIINAVNSEKLQTLIKGK